MNNIKKKTKQAYPLEERFYSKYTHCLRGIINELPPHLSLVKTNHPCHLVLGNRLDGLLRGITVPRFVMMIINSTEVKVLTACVKTVE